MSEQEPRNELPPRTVKQEVLEKLRQCQASIEREEADGSMDTEVLEHLSTLSEKLRSDFYTLNDLESIFLYYKLFKMEPESSEEQEQSLLAIMEDVRNTPSAIELLNVMIGGSYRAALSITEQDLA